MFNTQLASRFSSFGKFNVILAIIVIVLVLQAAYTIKDGSVGVLSTFGKFSDTVKMPGIHFKVPLVQSIIVEDVKMQTANYMGTKDLADESGIVNKPAITVMDKKNLPIGIEMTVQYTPSKSEMAFILRTFGSNYFEKKINPIIRAITRDIVGQYEAETIAVERQKISTELKTQLAKEFDAIPFVLNDVALRNIQLPTSVQQKILQVQEAKQEEERLKMAEKQAEVQKRIQLIDAQREAEKKVIAAKAEAEQKVIAAKAEAERITVQSKATADANKRVAISLTQLLVRQHAIEKWDGAYPKTMLGSEGNLLLSMPAGK